MNTVDVGDNAEYAAVAANLLSGKGYTAPLDAWSMREGVRTYFRSPGIPFIYTVPLFLFCRDDGYRITESNKTAVWLTLYLFQLLLVCLGTVYFYKLCQLFVKSPIAALIGTIVYIIWPSNLVYLSPAAVFVPESVVNPLLVWIFYVLISQKQSVSPIIAGIVLGCCLLTRAYLVFVPFFFFLYAFFLREHMPPRRLWIAGLVALIVLLPWPLRNYLVFGEFSLGSQGGWNLLIGNNAAARGSWDAMMWSGEHWNTQNYPVLRDLSERHPGLLDGNGHYSEREANKILQQEAIDWASANASALPWLLGRKLAIVFYPANFEGRGISWVTALGFLAFVPGLLLYVGRCWKRLESAEFLIFTIPILCICIVTLIFFAEYRQRFIMEPFMLLFALYAFRLVIVDKLVKVGIASHTVVSATLPKKVS